MRIAFAFLLSLIALPASATPVPERVWLGGERLTVYFPNGVTCRADVGQTGGAGRLEGCPHAADWQVVVRKRNYLEPLLGAAVSPYAVVTITDGRGRVTRFRTPPSLGRDDRH
ncbi:hypothetical protein OU426_10710 [Frigidibacter sp. RF13]|uniref:hypothetical protein n=1 Tax=Frigidibacter sp. RF13 TaxID=2997340 RepID=UPI0022721224|nr:hypothetical protein [Frigidibacter sp. RF13]MCY1127323.1 hypothetical protein [Frigidibacter sp. RF13]